MKQHSTEVEQGNKAIAEWEAYIKYFKYWDTKLCDCREHKIIGFAAMSSTGGENICAYCGKKRW